MTTETMREAVARTICRAGGHGQCVGFCHAQRCATAREQHGDEADAAIRTVLERLREPSEAVASAGMHGLSEITEDATWSDLAIEAKRIWQAMLDAAAREALPESADSGRG